MLVQRMHDITGIDLGLCEKLVTIIVVLAILMPLFLFIRKLFDTKGGMKL